MPDLSPYIGRWVAAVRGRIVGVGQTADQARRLAQRNRPKESPTVFFVTPDDQIAQAIAKQPLIAQIFDLGAAKASAIYLVGGSVRDLLLGKGAHDLDFAVDGDGLLVARHIANKLNGAYVAIDRERKTGRVVLPAKNGPRPYIDIASLRGPDLQADLRDRDFTINALAVQRAAQPGPHRRGTSIWRVVDPLNGQSDLRDGILRAASPTSFMHDPVRTLRAVRMCVQLGCKIEPQTERWLVAAVPTLNHTSVERIRDEWFKILQQPGASPALKTLNRLGLLPAIIPDRRALAQAEKFDHALASVEAIERLWDEIRDREKGRPHISRPWRKHRERLVQRYRTHICDERTRLALLKCATLLHGIDTAPGRSAEVAAGLMQTWHCSAREVALVRMSIAGQADVHLLAAEPALNKRMVYRFFRATGEYGIDAVLIALAARYARIDAQRRIAAIAARLLDDYYEHPERIDPPPLLSGHDLIALGLAPGPQMGKLLARLRESQATGEIQTRAQAIRDARSWIDRKE